MAKQKFLPMPKLAAGDIQRFWKYVDKRGPSDCWPWIGARTGGGYGNFVVRRKCYISHRIAFFLATGQDPGRRRVRHACDYPPCNNPDHHLLGSQTQNMQDADQRGRLARGERASHAKLTAAQVLEIRRRFANGEPRNILAKEFSVSYPSIYYITTRKAWSHI